MNCIVNNESSKRERIIINTFKIYIDKFDFRKYAPFYHGTSMKRAKSIKKFGLLTRFDASSLDIEENNKWGLYIRSLEDRIYFDTCVERSFIVKKSCQKAVEMDGESAISIDELNDKCAIFELVNFRPYIRFFDIDEDSKQAPKELSMLFSNDLYRDYTINNGFNIMKRMDRSIAQLYEEAFIVGGNRLVQKLIDNTPQALFSIYDWGTFAVTRSISPRDIVLVPYSTYIKRENCRDRVGYTDINEKAYRDFIQHHDDAHVGEFKKELAAGLGCKSSL